MSHNKSHYFVITLQLVSPITFGENVKTIVLPQQNEAPPAGATAVLAGWGRSAVSISLNNNSLQFCRENIKTTLNSTI